MTQINMALMVEQQLIVAPTITQEFAHIPSIYPTLTLSEKSHPFISTRITPGTKGAYICICLKSEKKNQTQNPNKKPKEKNGSILERFLFLLHAVIQRTVILIKSFESWHIQRNLMDQLNLELLWNFLV